MEWADDIKDRPRRANAGNRLQELLEHGLDVEDEEELRGWGGSDASDSDSSFTLGSDEEAMDELDSDFDAEEVAGVLEGEVVETEATVRRAERKERQQEREKRLRRANAYTTTATTTSKQKKKANNAKTERKRLRTASINSDSSGSDEDDKEGTHKDSEAESEEAVDDLRQRVRRRPPPTIPLADRLTEALARADDHRAVQAAFAQDQAQNGEAAPAMMHTHRGLNAGKSKMHRRRGGGGGLTTMGARSLLDERVGKSSGEVASTAPVFVAVSPRIALYECGMAGQRVAYSSGQSIRDIFQVPTIISFSCGLPPALCGPGR